MVVIDCLENPDETIKRKVSAGTPGPPPHHTDKRNSHTHLVLPRVCARWAQTLDLLYKMTSVNNVRIIVEKMLDYLRTTVDEYMRSDLVNRVTQLAEKFAPDNAWFVRTMATIFELGGYLVRPEVADNLMRLIAEGTGSAPAYM